MLQFEMCYCNFAGQSVGQQMVVPELSQVELNQSLMITLVIQVNKLLTAWTFPSFFLMWSVL